MPRTGIFARLRHGLFFPGILGGLLVLGGIVRANEFELKGGCQQGYQPDGVTALVTPDGRVAVRLSFGEGADALLVSYDPATGKRLDEQAFSIASIPTHLELVTVASSRRIVAFGNESSTAFAIFDLSSTGDLELRVTATVPVSGNFSVLARRAHPNLGVGFFRVTRQGLPSQLIAFSLDNGQVVSTYESLPFGSFLAVTTGASPTLVAPFGEPSAAAAAFVNVTDPAHMVGAGVSRYSWSYDVNPTGRVANALFTGDERHVFLADPGSGLWAMDLATRTFVGPRADPENANRILLREFASHRTLAAFGISGLSIYDADDPSNLVLRLRIATPALGTRVLMTPDGEQLVFQGNEGLQSIDTREGKLLWSYALEDLRVTYSSRAMYEIPPFGAIGGIWIGGSASDAFRGVSLNVPYGVVARFDGDDLVVTCLGADRKAVVVVDGVAKVTKQKKRSLGTLRVKGLRRELVEGQTIVLHVLNPTGTRSIDATAPVPGS